MKTLCRFGVIISHLLRKITDDKLSIINIHNLPKLVIDFHAELPNELN